ncbi:MAG: YicC/YloC family endoribonuclease [Aliishimia sp.]
MINSMTGYATLSGGALGYRWTWELRGVNGKGLDLRLRVPDWIDGLEASLRPLLSKAIGRGNVSLSLRVSREEGDVTQKLNTSAVDTVIAAMSEIEARAMNIGLSLSPSRAADIVTMRGVLEQGSDDGETGPLKAALLEQAPGLIASFNEMRVAEGTALSGVLSAQLQEIEGLTKAAVALLETRQQDMANTLRRNLAKVMDAAPEADDARVAQELAMIAVKSDVTEEIDRLHTHVGAADNLLATEGPIGRKFDFLMQEFNREANTLCSKAQMKELTETGLALKVLIDQMREQVQNVE